MKRIISSVVAMMLVMALSVSCGAEPLPEPTVDINALLGGAALPVSDGEVLDRPSDEPTEWVDPIYMPPIERLVSTVVIPPTLVPTVAPAEMVQVLPLVNGVVLEGVGGSAQVSVDLVFDNGVRVRIVDPVAQRVSFRSENPLVASVDDLGTLVGVSAGRTAVRVVSGEGPSAAVVVEVREVLPTLEPVGVFTTADVLVAEHGLGPLPPASIDMMVFIGDTESGLMVNRLIVRLAEGANVAAVAADHELQVLAELPDGVVVVDLRVSDMTGLQVKVVELVADARVKNTHPVMVVGLQ